MSPMLRSVEEAGISGMLKKRSPHQIKAGDFFEDSDKLRKSFAKLIHCDDPEKIAITASVSYGIATVVNNIKLEKGDAIIMVNEQFPSNYYSWQVLAQQTGARIEIIQPERDADSRGKSWNEKILNSINSQTKVVTMPHVHWADGTLFDLAAIRKATNDVGALLIIDGTQSVGALAFDVQKIQPDALICAGYKWLMGPYSIGVTYYGNAFDNGTPIEENWINRLDSENFAGLVNYESNYMPGSLRYEVGEHSNFILVPMLLRAIQQLNEWTPDSIQQYCKAITETAVQTLRGKGFLIEEQDYRTSHLFGIRVDPSKDIDQIKTRLENNNIVVSIRGNAIRVSPHVYNTPEEMNRLVECLID